MVSQRRHRAAFQVRIEEGVDVVRGDGQLAAAVDMDEAERAKPSHQEAVLQQGHVVAEHVVVRPADHDLPPASRGQPVVYGSDIRHDRRGFRIRLAAVVAQEEHERLPDPVANDAAGRKPIHINASPDPRIVMAEMQGGVSPERMAEDSDPPQVEAAQEPARLVPGRGAIGSVPVGSLQTHVVRPIGNGPVGSGRTVSPNRPSHVEPSTAATPPTTKTAATQKNLANRLLGRVGRRSRSHGATVSCFQYALNCAR